MPVATKRLFLALVCAIGITGCKGEAPRAVGAGARRPANPSMVPLEPKKAEALVAFAEAYTYVRNFHPSDASRKTGGEEWDRVAIEGARMVEVAGDEAAAIRGALTPYAPTLKVWRDGEPEPSAPRNIPDGASHVLVARQVVRGQPSDRFEADPLVVKVHSPLPRGARLPSDPVVKHLPGGWHFQIPTSLYAKKASLFGGLTTLPTSGDVPNLPASDAPPGDRWARIGTTIVAWVSMVSFEPENFPGVTDATRRGALIEALKASAVAADDPAMLRAFRAMIGTFADGHGRAWVEKPPSIRYGLPHARFQWAGSDLVVSKADPAVTSLRQGDRILELDGIPLAKRAMDALALESGSSRWKHIGALNPLFGNGSLLKGPLDVPLRAKVERAGRILDLTVSRVPVNAPGLLESAAEPGRVAPIKRLGENTVYVDLAHPGISIALLEGNKALLGSCPNVIFDARGNLHNEAFSMVSFWLDGSFPLPSIRYPTLYGPAASALSYETKPMGALKGKAWFHPARLVFLADGHDLSSSETLLGTIRNSRLGTIIGDVTGGANGNMFTFRLPGAYRVSRTGLSVVQGDGSQLNGVGISPDVLVLPSSNGIVEGRDEVLEAALASLR